MKEDVLRCLRKRSQRLDLEIAAEMRLPLATVGSRLAELSATGAVALCSLTRYDGGRPSRHLSADRRGRAQGAVGVAEDPCRATA